MIDQIQAISPFLSRFLSAFLFVENAVSLPFNVGFLFLTKKRHVKGKIRWLEWRRTLSRQLVVTIIRNDYFSRLRPQLLTHVSFPFVNDLFISTLAICRTDERTYIVRVRFWLAEISLIIGANCCNSFISSFDSPELIFAVVSNHIDPQRSCACYDSIVVVSLNYYDGWAETKEILLERASWTAIYHPKEGEGAVNKGDRQTMPATRANTTSAFHRAPRIKLEVQGTSSQEKRDTFSLSSLPLSSLRASLFPLDSAKLKPRGGCVAAGSNGAQSHLSV